jgi:D-tyrosyl-tRNA(Tyr) deacylase
MKLVVQRVKEAKVVTKDDGKTVGKINKGLFVLVGVGKEDLEKNAFDLALKLSKLRIMQDNDGKMNLSVKDANSSILVVSQFTLFADAKGGNRPSFINAEEPSKAKNIYDKFIYFLKDFGCKVEKGVFGAYMAIDVKLDGPVTIILEN